MKLKKYLSLDFDLGSDSGRWVFLIPFTVAILIRLIYHLLNIPDFWGDSYHTMYMSWATIENDWVYSDYKGREVVWLPFYRYLSTFLLYLFQKNDLIIPHFLNMLLGSITCGLVATLTRKLTDEKIGIFAGLLLSLSGWHVAYSHMNMPEITAVLLITLALVVWSNNKFLWLIPIGFAGVLTRNELTLLLGVFGIIILLKKDWKSAASLFVGSATGLAIWGWWNIIKRGELTWWIASRSRGSSWDRYFSINSGDHIDNWYIHIAIFISILPVILVMIYYSKAFKKAIRITPIWKSKEMLAALAITLFHWIFLMIMQTEYFTAPNGRYWLYSLPLSCVAYGILVFHIDKELKRKVILLSTSVSTLILLVMFIIFYQQRLIYSYNIQFGQYIDKEVPTNVNLWLDFPDILYFSKIDYGRAYSSEQIMPMQYRYIPDEEKVAFLTNKFDSLNIRYVVSSPVSYSIVLSLWPQMNEKEPFRWGDYEFTPIFSKENSKDHIVREPLATWMRFLGGVNKKSVLWKIEKSKGDL